MTCADWIVFDPKSFRGFGVVSIRAGTRGFGLGNGTFVVFRCNSVGAKCADLTVLNHLVSFILIGCCHLSESS